MLVTIYCYNGKIRSLFIVSINCFPVFPCSGKCYQTLRGIKDSVSQVIHLTSKFIIKENKILLEWNTTGRNGFYIIERSFNSKDFEVIGALKACTFSNNYEFIDEKPLIKRNYYRIKMQVSNERNSYSNTITAGIADSIFCKFYPNPVDKVINSKV